MEMRPDKGRLVGFGSLTVKRMADERHGVGGILIPRAVQCVKFDAFHETKYRPVWSTPASSVNAMDLGRVCEGHI